LHMLNADPRRPNCLVLKVTEVAVAGESLTPVQGTREGGAGIWEKTRKKNILKRFGGGTKRLAERKR